MSKSPPLALVGTFLQDFFFKKRWSSKLHEYRIWTHWETLVGPQISKRCQPLKLSNHHLTVTVANSTWLTQIQLMKSELMHIISKELRIQLNDIYFKVGEISQELKSSLPAKAQEKTPLSDKEVMSLNVWKNSESHLKDSELKKIILNILKHYTPNS